MRDIRYIIVHCSDTPTGRETTVEDIDRWHKERGFKRDNTYRSAFNPTLESIGYHYVICLDGEIYTGRQVAEVGAHCSGRNSMSIGICLVGKGMYTVVQWDALKELIDNLLRSYPGAKVIGHRDCPTAVAQGKTCPDFDVANWVAGGSIDEHIA